jgi:plastocyanin
VSNNAQVTVSDAPPQLTSVTIAASATTMNVGSTLQLNATSRDQYGSIIAANVGWSSSNSGIASVSGTGLVSGVSGGSATITATAVAAGVTVIGTVGLTVVALPTSAQVSATVGNTFVPGSVNIARGGTVTWSFATVHNVTFANATGAPANIGDTGSGSVSRTFGTAGEFEYVCTLHSGMAGTVTVQ